MALTALTNANAASNLSPFQPFSVRQLKAFSVACWMTICNGNGKGDYRPNHKSLVLDSSSFCKGISFIDTQESWLMTAMRASADWNSAFNFDSTIGTDVLTFLNTVKEFEDFPEPLLDQMIFWLRNRSQL